MAISNRLKDLLNNMNRRAKLSLLGSIIQTVENLAAANASALNSKSIVHSSIVTTSGGAAAEDVAISGVLATDQCYVQLSDDGTNDVSILSAVCAEDKVTITFSGDPAADAVVNVLVLR